MVNFNKNLHYGIRCVGSRFDPCKVPPLNRQGGRSQIERHGRSIITGTEVKLYICLTATLSWFLKLVVSQLFDDSMSSFLSEESFIVVNLQGLYFSSHSASYI